MADSPNGGVITGRLPDGDLIAARLITIALSFGTAIFITVSAAAQIWGGHLNPAVTIAATATFDSNNKEGNSA